MAMLKIWTRYLKILDRYPLRTQMMQTGVIMGTGDVISQLVIERKPNFEISRSIRFGVIGSFFVAPTIRMWYLTLERWFGAGVTIKTTLRKVAADQLLFAPIFSAAIIGVIGTSQSISKIAFSLEEDKKKFTALQEDIFTVAKKLKADYKDVLITGWTIWPATQIANFYLVPFLLRPLVVSVVALFWNTYLAWKTNREIVIVDNI